MKRAIVTGASSGIGRAVAEILLENGWTVGLLARRKEQLDEVASGRAGAMTLAADVTDAAQVEEAFDRFTGAHGGLDLLFNNAGIFVPPAMIDDIPLADWDRSVAVNLTGMFLCARAAFGVMRHQSPQGGRIINNGSISAHVPRDGAVCYTVTKHAITGLTRQLALDGREVDIACGQIDIGNARTDMVETLITRAREAGEPVPESFDVRLVAQSVLQMAQLPLSANVLFQTIMATKMPYVGRG
jgi:NAD(P)-dependent dehydrogenase (short-subunit alcohol dehydrogenase family)